VRTEFLSMGMGVRVVPWGEIRFLLRVMFGVRVEMVIWMVPVLLFLTYFIRTLFHSGMVF
jgi:hypothetical protein